MKLVTLLRHAKSSWKEEGQPDHERPLNKRGRQDAPMMAARLIEQGPEPDTVLCSTAVRARETLSLFADVCGISDQCVDYRDELYLASARQLRTLITSMPAKADHLLLVGHNPGMEDLLMELADRADLPMPTCAMAQLQLAGDAFDLTEPARLLWFDYPKRGQ